MKILMNSAMMPQEGDYKLRKVSKNEFIQKWKQCNDKMHSSIGYNNVADNLTRWLGEKIPVNRTKTYINDGDTIFVCKLEYRLNHPSMKKNYVPKSSDYEFFIGHYKSVHQHEETI